MTHGMGGDDMQRREAQQNTAAETAVVRMREAEQFQEAADAEAPMPSSVAQVLRKVAGLGPASSLPTVDGQTGTRHWQKSTG